MTARHMLYDTKRGVSSGVSWFCNFVQFGAVQRERETLRTRIESGSFRSPAIRCILAQVAKNGLKGRCSTTELRPLRTNLCKGCDERPQHGFSLAFDERGDGAFALPLVVPADFCPMFLELGGEIHKRILYALADVRALAAGVQRAGGKGKV